jgi:hypothetical protein
MEFCISNLIFKECRSFSINLFDLGKKQCFLLSKLKASLRGISVRTLIAAAAAAAAAAAVVAVVVVTS